MTELWNRSVDEWLNSVESAEIESARLCPNRTGSERQELIELLCDRLTGAAQSWEEVGPETPTSEACIDQMMNLLVDGRFVTVTRN